MSSGQPLPSDREMAKVQAKANLLLALYSHASDELERMRAEVDDLRSHATRDLEGARAEADSLRRKLADVRSELANARGELADARGELADAHREFADARKDLERVQRELGETRHARDRSTERNSRLQQQHDALLASTSWRITAPIRAVARIAKRQ